MPNENAAVPTCPHCGYAETDFSRTTFLGCPRCYETFQFQIWTMLPRIHVGETHCGKVPLNRQTQPA